MSVTIEVATAPSPALLEGLNRLLPQLSTTAPPLTSADLAALLASPGATVFVAWLDGRVVGTLTLVEYAIPTGRRAWIEDVVVDASARQRGVAADLTRAAVDRAAAQGHRQVELTSRPARVAANALYVKLGFQPRETNVYRISLDG